MKTRLPELLFALLAASVLNASAETRYVDLNSPSSTPPYTDWLTAATNIQDAVNAATNGDLVLVNDGMYQSGFQLSGIGVPESTVETNRLVIDKLITLQSVNGPAAASIDGGGMYRCVYLTDGAVLSGFSLLNGVAGYTYVAGGRATNTVFENGGGVRGGSVTIPVLSGVVSNCTIISNSATGDGGGAYGVKLLNCTLAANSARSGGGASRCTLINCKVVGNSAATNGPPPPILPAYVGVGGGLYLGPALNCVIAGNKAWRGGGTFRAASLINCTVVSNVASFDGGVTTDAACYLTNCIVGLNAAGANANYGTNGTYVFDHCSALPLPGGSGNISNAPTFVDLVGGDFHLQTNSSCINAGINAGFAGTSDVEGNPRISGGTVDMGAYEFQSPASVLSYAWAQQNGLPTDGSADFTDTDFDGANNWQEWRADTVPTNAASVLAMTSVTNRVAGLGVSWASVATRSYWLERAGDLGAVPPFQIIATNIPGVPGTKIFNDISATNGGPYFYRVGVQ